MVSVQYNIFYFTDLFGLFRIKCWDIFIAASMNVDERMSVKGKCGV